MLIGEIKKIISVMKQKYKYNDSKFISEMNNLKTFIRKSDFFIGDKYKLYKIINDYKK